MHFYCAEKFPLRAISGEELTALSVEAGFDMSKYDPLTDYLRQIREGHWQAQFSEIENILGFKLPPSARKYNPWWANEAGNPNRQSNAWLSVGWMTMDIDLKAESVTFRRKR